MSCDITNESHVLQTIDQIAATYGRIDVLVNNAGAINDPVHFHEMSDSDIMNLINVNMLGVFKMTKVVVVKMLERKDRKSVV